MAASARSAASVQRAAHAGSPMPASSSASGASAAASRLSGHDVVRIDHAGPADLHHRRAARGHPLGEHLRRRRPADAHDDVGPGGGELGVAQEGVGAGDRTGDVASPRHRIGQQRPARRLDERRQLGAARTGGTGEDEPTRPAQQVHHAGWHLADRRHGRPGVVRWPRRQRPGGADERLPERQVEVHRTAGGGGDGPGAERAPHGRGRRVGHARVVEPAHRAAVQVGLVDGLRGPDVAQLRRPVGGDDDHRDIGEPRLHDGRMEVGGGRPTRAQQHGGHPVESGAEGDEGGDALVVDDVDGQLGPVQQGQGDGRAARAGRHDRVAHPVGDQLVDEGGAARRLHVGRAHVSDDTGDRHGRRSHLRLTSFARSKGSARRTGGRCVSSVRSASRGRGPADRTGRELSGRDSGTSAAVVYPATGEANHVRRLFDELFAVAAMDRRQRESSRIRQPTPHLRSAVGVVGWRCARRGVVRRRLPLVLHRQAPLRQRPRRAGRRSGVRRRGGGRLPPVPARSEGAPGDDDVRRRRVRPQVRRAGARRGDHRAPHEHRRRRRPGVPPRAGPARQHPRCPPPAVVRRAPRAARCPGRPQGEPAVGVLHAWPQRR